MSGKSADDKRRDAKEYMRIYREKNPPNREYSQRSNEKRKKLLKSLPIMECKCGGTYKNYAQCKQKHLETYKHQAWYAEKHLIKVMVRSGEVKDKTAAKRQLDKRLKTKCAWTDKRKVIALDEIGQNINNIMKAANHKEETKPRRKSKETHHEKMIRMAAAVREEEEEEEDLLSECFPEENIIIEAKNSPPSTAPPSSSEEEESDGETEHTDEHTDTQSEKTESECSDDDRINEIKQQLKDDKEIALRRFNRFKDAKPADSYAPPPPKFDMCEYLEEASITTDDGSDILKKLGLLTHNKKGSEKYQFL